MVKTKIILVMVTSLDGKTTRWRDPKIFKWTSVEDNLYFSKLINSSKVVLMGRKTYQAAKKNLKLSSKLLRLVMTNFPETYSQDTVPGQLEFTSNIPEKIVEEVSRKGIKEILLVGGANLNGSFFRKKLINEIWLTIEPKIFGTGTPLLLDKKFDINLNLKEIKKLNRKGTLLLKYKVR